MSSFRGRIARLASLPALATTVATGLLLTIAVGGAGPASAVPPVSTSTSAAASPPVSPPPVESRNAPVMVVLDASGSMTIADAPGPRIDAAKRAVSSLVGSLPADARVGLEVYGTSTGSEDSEKAAGCRDIKILQPVGPIDRSAFLGRVRSIRASGYTPIGESLRRAAAALPAGGPRSIVLVSDGEDTCAPPGPCDVARELKAQGVDLTVHTVGFRVGGAARSQLRCIAKATGGEYRDADDGGSLTDVLDDQVRLAIRGYRAVGAPITGGETTGAAPVVTPGQYVDRYAHGAETASDTGTTKYYRVDLADGDTPYVSATLVPPARKTRFLDSVGLRIEIRPLDSGSYCSATGYDSSTVTDGKAPTVTAVVAPGETGGTKSCLTAGPAVIKVERTGDALVEQPMDLELAYRVERPADAGGLPGPATAHGYDRPTVSGTGRVTDSGSSFNDAPAVGTGVYRDTVTPGEERYLKVHLDWGQQLSFAFSSATERGWTLGDGVSARLTLVNPLRQATSQALGANTSTPFVGALDSALYGSSPVPVRYRNREADDSNVQRFSLAGDYYLVLSTGFADSGRSTRIPYTMRVQVTGTPERGPDYGTRGPVPPSTPPTGPSGSASASVPPSGGASTGSSGASGSLVAGRAESDPGASTPLLVGGITVAVLLLAGLGGGLLHRRRRTDGDHTRVLPTGYGA